MSSSKCGNNVTYSIDTDVFREIFGLWSKVCFEWRSSHTLAKRTDRKGFYEGRTESHEQQFFVK